MKERKLIILVTFSLPSSSSLLKVLNVSVLKKTVVLNYRGVAACTHGTHVPEKVEGEKNSNNNKIRYESE